MIDSIIDTYHSNGVPQIAAAIGVAVIHEEEAVLRPTHVQRVQRLASIRSLGKRAHT